MANLIDTAEGSYTDLPNYTASYSPYLQGVELRQLYQLTNFGLKIRSNTSFVLGTNGFIPGYQSNSQNSIPFNDTIVQNNYGDLILSSSVVYSLGIGTRSGTTTVVSSSTKSSVNLFSPQRLSTFVSHASEQRDLGQTDVYTNGEPFVEIDSIEKDPVSVIRIHPAALQVPVSLVQVNSLAGFDGVIEPFEIRKISDRTSTELPYIFRTIKSSLSNVDSKGRSLEIDDFSDTRSRNIPNSVTPFLDVNGTSHGSAALLKSQNIVSDQESHILSFDDSFTEKDIDFSDEILDPKIKNLFLSGVTIDSSQYPSPDLNVTPKFYIISNHGFVFSQNDNFNYESIAFGGLKR